MEVCKHPQWIAASQVNFDFFEIVLSQMILQVISIFILRYVGILFKVMLHFRYCV
jgi:hypothetical protein